jgi:deoxyribodipyrimidine photo-lyase
MQAAQRARSNDALEWAVQLANNLKVPVVVLFALTENYLGANYRHYYFMLQGLNLAADELAKRGIKFVVRFADEPWLSAVELGRKACAVVTDAGYLRIQRQWRQKAAEELDCAFYEVETNLIVPAWLSSSKENFSAKTFRPRINSQLERFLAAVRTVKLVRDSMGVRIRTENISDIEKVIDKLGVDKSVGKAVGFEAGWAVAAKRLRVFIKDKLSDYAEKRNAPSLDYQSGMSPYLHFGQISPAYIAIQVRKSQAAGAAAFLEEMIVRRELAHNFVYYNERYDDFDGLEPWSKLTLNFHGRDKRQYVYSLAKLEAARTHDEYWNACQREMVFGGKMHGYMRMYWGKKILEWSKKPTDGIKAAVYLNDKYELDGRDPSGYAGVLWCFGKHDRAWGERKVFGKVRYMNAAGLERKFDMGAYVEKVNRLEEMVTV